MDFLSFVALLVVAYLVWRVTDQLPDLIFRLSEIQRDVAEMRRRMADESESQQSAPATTTATTPAASGDSDD